MGAQICSTGGSDVVMSLMTAGEIDGLAKIDFKGSYSSEGYPTHGQALEVAEMIAADRCKQSFQAMSSISEHFDVKEAGVQDPPAFCTAFHRTTGMVRRLHSLRKPSGVESQERLRAHILRLQAQKCEGLARILEVFEDARAISLVTEHCSGGTVYDRILQRQYFAEQESAMLVRHMLQSLHSMHCAGLSHGHPSPDSFRFHSDQPHASLKLVDFGLELKVRLCEGLSEAASRTECLQLFQACHVVFCAPEIFKQLKAERAGELRPGQPASSLRPQGPGRPAASARPLGKAGEQDLLDFNLLAEAIDTHLEMRQDFGMHEMLAPADAWSVGAIAFLLLCGYPPFFAPCRHAILARVDKVDFSFDPPFWSKISEEAKDFVQRCLHGVPCRRLTITEALQHPWIQSLADTSPCGSMLSSFAVNLRRFYRTSLIEAFAASSLAAKLSYKETVEMQHKCEKADSAHSGFLTSTDLRQVLHNSGHADVAEAIGTCFNRPLRHPGESYLDYTALLECTRFRREQLLEEEIWTLFRAFDVASGSGAGQLPASRLGAFLQAPAMSGLLVREGAEATLPRSAENGFNAAPGKVLYFIEAATSILQHIRSSASGDSSST
eukprot:TRINITY_DN112751_c0_g1_i1.p1 TRINITY_DN112751_c0_g1~~TRINITY_DN112751_c0_g1_i1.p1  ORF type:complete len:621 (-),score=161.08 TRINITY_DN112751_c0_g1_i1:16-1842(-)